MLIYSPLEQFQVQPISLLYTNAFCFSLMIVILFNVIYLSSFFLSTIIPSNLQYGLELTYSALLNIVKNTIDYKINLIYFPFIYTLFIFILFSNLTGLVPYTFTVTSHLSVTLAFSVMIFLATN